MCYEGGRVPRKVRGPSWRGSRGERGERIGFGSFRSVCRARGMPRAGRAAIRKVTAMGISARVLTGFRCAFGPCLGLGLDAGRKAPGGPLGWCRGIEATEMGLECDFGSRR